MGFIRTHNVEWQKQALEYMTAAISTMDENHPIPLVGEYRIGSHQTSRDPSYGLFVWIERYDPQTNTWHRIEGASAIVFEYDYVVTDNLDDMIAEMYDAARETLKD